MKKTLVTPCLADFPKDYHPLLADAPLFDSSCSRGAQVYYIPKGEGFYLKRGAEGSLEKEASLARWFAERGLAPKVLDYRREGADWLLTAAAKGEDCTHFCHEPARLAETLGKILRALHEMPIGDCPEQNRLKSYFSTAKENFQKGRFDLSYGDFSSAEQAFGLIEREGHLLQRDALLHGDYCLPNILLKEWQFSAFIDLGAAGAGDRHIDLYWALWSLQYNLKTDAFAAPFKEAYGRHLIEEDKLRLISAFEIFG